MISIRANGSYDKTRAYLQKLARGDFFAQLDSLAARGAAALADASPVDSGLAANSWTYTVERNAGSCTISWFNTDVESGFPVAVMLQYGYSTGTGGYVAGRDYINPAMKPIFDQIQTEVWKVVTSS
jgi:hypothetical protein